MFKKITLIVTSIIAISLFVALPASRSAQTTSIPALPDAGTAIPVAQASTSTATPIPVIVHAPEIQAPAPEAVHAAEVPVSVSIPSIGLSDQIVPVGLNSQGAMDVPSGKTSNVGWYSAGTIPGDVGSAVLDAHVFAAFSKLHNVSVGADIYVTMASGHVVHFKVTETDTYPLAQVPADRLFNPSDAAHLNLITCAGSLTPDHSTYDHRFVAYATLVQ